MQFAFIEKAGQCDELIQALELSTAVGKAAEFKLQELIAEKKEITQKNELLEQKVLCFLSHVIQLIDRIACEMEFIESTHGVLIYDMLGNLPSMGIAEISGEGITDPRLWSIRSWSV